jgi:hypothetical protein
MTLAAFAKLALAHEGAVFDLRQQLDFIEARATIHGGGLNMLAGDREEEP